MAQNRNVGPMSTQPQRHWDAVPVGETLPDAKLRKRSNRVSATRAGLLRQQALRMQRALLAGVGTARKSSST